MCSGWIYAGTNEIMKEIIARSIGFSDDIAMHVGEERRELPIEVYEMRRLTFENAQLVASDSPPGSRD